MTETDNSQNENGSPRVVVEAADVEGIAEALGMKLVEDPPDVDESTYPAELYQVLATLSDIYEGVQEVTETDSRGRSRKIVRQYADREDLSSDQVGHILRVLEAHELVAQDGNRWRIPGTEE